MSALRKKANRKEIRETKTDTFGDVTIDDFANTLRIHGRIKKSITNVSNEVKEEAAKEELVWNEEDEETSLRDSTRGRRSRRRLKSQKENDENEGIDYLLDIWFIISEYIEPEAIGKFARICKSSYYVTTTGKFWFHLYKKYYKFVSDMPERLQPQCMSLYGLRARVIRALYYSYFKTPGGIRCDMSYLRPEEPDSLVKRKCTLMWHKEVKGRWIFYFKLKEISKTRNTPLKRNKQHDKKTEFLDILEDVAVNPEDGCKVLRVSCLKYSMIPPVIGLVLQTAYAKLVCSRGVSEQQLYLEFGTSDVHSTLTNQIILRNVMAYNILNWWDPIYPHQDVSRAIELPQSDSWD